MVQEEDEGSLNEGIRTKGTRHHWDVEKREGRGQVWGSSERMEKSPLWTQGSRDDSLGYSSLVSVTCPHVVLWLSSAGLNSALPDVWVPPGPGPSTGLSFCQYRELDSSETWTEKTPEGLVLNTNQA
jgi:hypothetical protein